MKILKHRTADKKGGNRAPGKSHSQSSDYSFQGRQRCLEYIEEWEFLDVGLRNSDL